MSAPFTAEMLAMLSQLAHARGIEAARKTKRGPVLYALVRAGLVEMAQYRDGKPPVPQITKAGRVALTAPRAPTTWWAITGAGGVNLGVHDGSCAVAALDSLARSTGCKSHAAACEATGERHDDWTTDRDAFLRGEIALLVEDVTEAFTLVQKNR